MVVSETIQYITILGITIIFSAFSLINIEQKLVMKVSAGLCWFIMALTQFFFFGVTQALTIPLMFMFLGFGLIFSFSIVTDFKNKKHDAIWNFND